MRANQRPPITERDLWVAFLMLAAAIIALALVFGFAVRVFVWMAGG